MDPTLLTPCHIPTKGVGDRATLGKTRVCWSPVAPAEEQMSIAVLRGAGGVRCRAWGPAHPWQRWKPQGKHSSCLQLPALGSPGGLGQAFAA